MKEKPHDCRTCKYGWADDHWNIPFCHKDNCVKWELWEPKEEKDEEAK